MKSRRRKQKRKKKMQNIRKEKSKQGEKGWENGVELQITNANSLLFTFSLMHTDCFIHENPRLLFSSKANGCAGDICFITPGIFWRGQTQRG